jgi:hypothetical protein
MLEKLNILEILNAQGVKTFETASNKEEFVNVATNVKEKVSIDVSPWLRVSHSSYFLIKRLDQTHLKAFDMHTLMILLKEVYQNRNLFFKNGTDISLRRNGKDVLRTATSIVDDQVRNLGSLGVEFDIDLSQEYPFLGLGRYLTLISDLHELNTFFQIGNLGTRDYE